MTEQEYIAVRNLARVQSAIHTIEGLMVYGTAKEEDKTQLLIVLRDMEGRLRQSFKIGPPE